jgi:hypothetical protein
MSVHRPLTSVTLLWKRSQTDLEILVTVNIAALLVYRKSEFSSTVTEPASSWPEYPLLVRPADSEVRVTSSSSSSPSSSADSEPGAWLGLGVTRTLPGKGPCQWEHASGFQLENFKLNLAWRPAAPGPPGRRQEPEPGPRY